MGNPEHPQACPSRRTLQPGGTAGGGRMNGGSWVRGQGVGCSPNSTIHHSLGSWFPKWSSAEPGSSLPTLRPTLWGLFLECSPPLWPLATEDTGEPARTWAPSLHAGEGPDTGHGRSPCTGLRGPPGHPTHPEGSALVCSHARSPPQQVRGTEQARQARDSCVTKGSRIQFLRTGVENSAQFTVRAGWSPALWQQVRRGV